MSTPIDFLSNEGLRTFSGLVVDIANANFETITTEAMHISLNDSITCPPDEILEGYNGGTIMMATEGKTGFEVGLIFATKDITTLADLMLMGPGDAKEELDEDLKDSVMEIANQFFGALTASVDTQMGKKLQFRVDDAVKFQNTSIFQSDSYILFDLKGEMKGTPFQFRFYADDNISSLLEVQESNEMPAMPDFFGGMDDVPQRPSAGAGTNMDMLMDIDIPVSVRMGSAKLFLKDILGLGPGNIVELEQNASDLIELTVNDKVVARGEVVIVDGYFGFRIKEIISKAERIKKLKD